MIGASLLLAAAALPSTLLNGLAAYYKCDTLADELGVHNLTNAGTACTHPAGIIGNAIQAGDASSYLTPAGGITLVVGVGDAFTISAWVKVASQAGHGTIAAAGGAGVGLYVDTSGKFSFYNGVGFTQSTIGWSAGVRAHAVCTYDVATTTLKYFVNGAAAGSSVISGFGGFTINALMGYAGGGSVLPLGDGSGNLDEVGLWTRVLSGTELTALYNAGAGKSYPF